MLYLEVTLLTSPFSKYNKYDESLCESLFNSSMLCKNSKYMFMRNSVKNQSFISYNNN